MKKFLKWWWFTVKNPVIRKGEVGGFRWVFRRFWLEISTKSGNFTVKFTADENPYGYLVAGKDDSNVHGFALTMYEIGKMLTTDQGFVDDIQRAVQKYSKRLEKKAKGEVVEDETEEKVAVEEVKKVQDYVEKSPKERRKLERDANGRFKKAVARDLPEKEA